MYIKARLKLLGLESSQPQSTYAPDSMVTAVDGGEDSQQIPGLAGDESDCVRDLRTNEPYQGCDRGDQQSGARDFLFHGSTMPENQRNGNDPTAASADSAASAAAAQRGWKILLAGDPVEQLFPLEAPFPLSELEAS